MTFYFIECVTPLGEEPALISYQPDVEVESNEQLRQWNSGRTFVKSPPSPVAVSIEEGEGGLVKALYWSPVCLMTRRLVAALTAAKVTNLEVFDATIHDHNDGADYATHQAVNIVGSGTLELALPMFRLVSGGVVVSESVRDALLAAGIETLEFTAA